MNDFNEVDFDQMFPEAVDASVSVTEESLIASGLRKMADIVDRLYAVDKSDPAPVVVHFFAYDKDGFSKLGRALGTFTKSADDNWFNLDRTFDGGSKVQVCIGRSKVCKRVLLRVEEVPEQVIPASKREVYGWECGGPVMADAPAIETDRQAVELPPSIEEGMPF